MASDHGADKDGMGFIFWVEMIEFLEKWQELDVIFEVFVERRCNSKWVEHSM